jgi:uncharacterized membrane protein
MQIDNPLGMNDWDIKEFLKAILIIQIAIYGVIILDSSGIHVPVLRPLIAFVYLTFVPGIVLLRALKMHRLDNAQTVLYAVGLSIMTVMFTGFCINTIYPRLGIEKPIALTPLIVTLTAIVLLLCIVAYVRDREFRNPGGTSGITLSAPFLSLSIIPFLAIFGTYLLNFYQNNAVQLLLIVVIALLVLLMAWSRFIPDDLHPYAVFVMALTLLYHGSLISTYLAGYDIFAEYSVAALVLSNGIWDSTFPALYNSALSVSILAPIMATVTGMTLVQVFKVVYPLLYALVPVGLYVVYKRMTDTRVALLAAFFFVAFFTFYLEMVWLAKEEIAQLFLVLSLLLLTDRQMNTITRGGLLIVFVFSIIVAHYATAYFFVFMLMSAWLILQLEDRFNLQGRLSRFRSPTKEHVTDKVANNRRFQEARGSPLNVTVILLFLVLSFAWYVYLAGSVSFEHAVSVMQTLFGTTSEEFLNPTASQGLQLLTAQVSGLHSVAQYLHYVTQALIVIGFVLVFSKRIKTKFERPYLALSAGSLALLVAAVLVPHVASTLNTSRIYALCLVFLAPFAVLGAIAIYKWACGLRGIQWNDTRLDSSLRLMSIFFVVYLLFNCGFVYVIAHDPNSSPWLTGNESQYQIYSVQDVAGGVWLSAAGGKDLVITDSLTYFFVRSVLSKDNMARVDDWTGAASGAEHLPAPSYWYFIASKNPDVNLQATNKKVIYDNGDVRIYY